MAATHGNDKIVEFLLGREGIDANGVAPGEPRPPVLIAAHHGFHKVKYHSHSCTAQFNKFD